MLHVYKSIHTHTCMTREQVARQGTHPPALPESRSLDREHTRLHAPRAGMQRRDEDAVTRQGTYSHLPESRYAMKR